MLSQKIKKIFINFSIVFFIFFIDRISKIYILRIAHTKGEVDIYVNPFLNFILLWNKGIGFGLLSFDQSQLYNLITVLIFIINVIIIYIIYKTNDFKIYFYLMVLGGSFGNLFDRIHYSAVPDFIDLHINDFHWFIFNIADIFISFGVICLIFVEIIFKKKIEQ
tara:strand:+ start:601 stop:1092 length:492 start_codon:yes stop_codon:yes gene_type:complete